MIGIVDLRRKRLLGKHMTQELLDKGFVSVLDLRFHPIMEIYGSRRSDHSECRRLRLTLRELGMVWTRFIDFDKGCETFSMAAFDQMCYDFSDVEDLLRTRLVHAQLLDFYIRFFPEALFDLFANLPDQTQIRCRSALLLFANRVAKHAKQSGDGRGYDRGVLLLQAQAMTFSRVNRYNQGKPAWRAFIDRVFEWLSLFYFSARERELLAKAGIRLPEALDIERGQIDRNRCFQAVLQQRVVTFIGHLRRLNDLFYTCTEEQLQTAIKGLPMQCLPDEVHEQVLQLSTNLGHCPALLVVRLFIAHSPSPTYRYWNYRILLREGAKRMSRPYVCPEDMRRAKEDQAYGRTLWSTWLPERYGILLGNQGVKWILSPQDRELLRKEGLTVGIRPLHALLSMVYDLDYIQFDNQGVFILKSRFPHFQLRQILEWAEGVKERQPRGVTASLSDALQGVDPADYPLLLPLVRQVASTYKLPLPDDDGFLTAKASCRLTRDGAVEILRTNGAPMTVGELAKELVCRFPEADFSSDEHYLRSIILRDKRFVALKRTGYYALAEWHTDGHLSLKQRVLRLLQDQDRPMSIDGLRSRLLDTNPALAQRNLRALLGSLLGKEVEDYGLGFYGLKGRVYEGYLPLSRVLRSDLEFDRRYQELKAYVERERVFPMTIDPEGVKLALWWNRFDEGVTRLTVSQRKQVVQFNGWMCREGIPCTPKERLFRDRCLSLMALLQEERRMPDDGELADWYRSEVAGRTRWNGVYKVYVRRLMKVVSQYEG